MGGRERIAFSASRVDRPDSQLPGEDGVLRAASSVAPVRLGRSKLVLVACWESLQPVWWLCGCFGLRGARLDGVSALCGRYSWRDHRMLTGPDGGVYPGSGSGQATPVNHAASDLQANDLGRTHRRSETIANVTDGHGCRPRARCGKTVAIVCWRGVRSRFLIASRGGSRVEQWSRCGGGVGR